MNFDFNTTEQLIITKSLRLLINNEETHPIDKQLAEQIIEKINNKWKNGENE